MAKGSASIRARIDEIAQKGLDAAPKEKSLLTVLEMTLEMWSVDTHSKRSIYIAHMQQTLLLMETH